MILYHNDHHATSPRSSISVKPDRDSLSSAFRGVTNTGWKRHGYRQS